MLYRILICFFLCPLSWSVNEPARTALVLGNWKYDSVGELNHVDNDVMDMADALKQAGFTVILLENGTRKGMLKAIEQFGGRLKEKKGVGLIYYTGHGIQVGGNNYMVPVDLKLSSEDNVKYDAVDVGRILDKMASANNGFNIIILDACRNNPFGKSLNNSQEGLARISAPQGSIIAYATDPGKIASTGNGRNSTYTKYLLEAIKTPNIPIEEVFKRVLRGVVTESKSKQVPWISTSFTGDFYFMGKPQSTIPLTYVPADQSMWKLVESSDVPTDIKQFLDTYPTSTYAPVAKLKLAQLTRQHGDGSPKSRDDNVGDLLKQAYELQESDKKESAKLFLRAAEKGNSDAMFQVGQLFRRGDVFDQNYKEARKWYEKAWSKGNPDGIYWIARMYEDGLSVDKDHVKAVSWLKKGADKGDPWSQYLLATHYFSGLGIDRDVRQAVKYFKMAADQGNSVAQFELGDAYYYGRGVPVDFKTAVIWYQKAADQGDSDAQYSLGLAYASGEGVEQSYEKAAKWYQKVVDQGKRNKAFRDASYNLGNLYSQGRGVAQNVPKSINLYIQAGEEGLGKAWFNLGLLYQNGAPGLPKNTEKAVDYYLKANELDYADAALNIGAMYRKGNGMPQDDKKAFKWYVRAGDLGSIIAARNLEAMYRLGIGVEKNPQKAQEWAAKSQPEVGR